MSKKTKTSHLMDFAIPGDQGVKIEESEKMNKFNQRVEKSVQCDGGTNCIWSTWSNPQRFGRKYWKNWRSEFIQTTALLKSAKILRRVLET